MAKNINLYSDAGVSLSKASISVGDTVVVSYDGLLAKSGADTIFMHYGYGDSWEQKDFIRMENKEGIFGAAIKVITSGSLNLSFKDSADNWDNNSSENYSFKVSKKENSEAQPKAPAKVKKAVEQVVEKPAAKAAVPKKAAKKPKAAAERKDLM
jgi:hypothetical protein